MKIFLTERVFSPSARESIFFPMSFSRTFLHSCAPNLDFFPFKKNAIFTRISSQISDHTRQATNPFGKVACIFLLLYFCLELCGTGCSWEWDNVADVAHTSDVHDQALKAQTITCMFCAAIFAQIQIPGVVFFFETQFTDTIKQNIVALLTLAAADDFADTWNQKVCCCNSLVVVV
jgi:hypothetical protein